MNGGQPMMIRRFQLQRDADDTGVSGTGVVAEGCEFSDGHVVLRWITAWPTSVVFHERGMESVEKVHGHNGNTRIVYLDGVTTPSEAVVEAVREAMEAYSSNLRQRIQESTGDSEATQDLLEVYQRHVLADVDQFLAEARP